MIAVSNTTPLPYLIAVEQEHLLGELFEKVFVPAAIHAELTDVRTPELVRRALSPPAWFEVRAAQESGEASFPVALHQGEREAILLAGSLRLDVLLIDEQIGRAIAPSRNLPLSGTLGVLKPADSLGFVTDFPQILKSLKVIGFFLAEALELELLQRHRARRGIK